MNTRLTIDKAGRVVIPKPVREELLLEPGDSLEMESAGEQITLRPVRGTGPLTKEHGVWVFHSGQPLPASATPVSQANPLNARGGCDFGPDDEIPAWYYGLPATDSAWQSR